MYFVLNLNIVYQAPFALLAMFESMGISEKQCWWNVLFIKKIVLSGFEKDQGYLKGRDVNLPKAAILFWNAELVTWPLASCWNVAGKKLDKSPVYCNRTL